VKVIVGVILVAGSIAAACASKPPAAQLDGAPVTVSLGRAEVTERATPFEAGGVVRARTTALVASRVAAPITEVHVQVGDRVRRGAALVTLDAREIRANRARAVASSLAAAESARAADADIRAAESAVVLAQVTRDRMSALHATRSATAQELDQAVAGLTAAEAQATGARARLAAANAARDAAQAAADGAEIGMTYSVLSAPFDGVVTDRHADAGSMAMPGAPLITLEDASAFRLETQVDEARAALVAVGQAVEVRFDNAAIGRGEWLGARVVEIAHLEATTHSFVIKLELPHALALRSGLFGRVRFAGPPRRALTAPVSALLARGQLTFVFLVDGGRARLRPISTGAADTDRVEVLAGLREGDVVVTNPSPSLSDGARVTGVKP
jgi:multidrug efflux pump subunit AcrA (membrane-fusion protein)